MDTRTEPIRQDINQIRDSMTDKMEQIEAKIKGTVEDTTETLKRGLDVKYQVSEHPWAALGAAVLAGYALGSMGGSDTSSSSYRSRNEYQHNDYRNGDPTRYYGPNNSNGDWQTNQNSGSQSAANGLKNDYSPRSQDDRTHQQSSSNGFLDQVMGEIGIEMDTLKTAAIASLISLVRDTVKQNLPGVYDEAERLRTSSGSSQSSASTSTSGSASGSYAGNDSSSYNARSGVGASQTNTTGNGEGEFYRSADITEGRTPRYDRTDEIYPAGSSESDRDPSVSTQRDVGRNPNYDMIPPSPHANPDGRP